MNLPVLRPTRHTRTHARTHTHAHIHTHTHTYTPSYIYASALGLPAAGCNSVHNSTVRTKKWYLCVLS